MLTGAEMPQFIVKLFMLSLDFIDISDTQFILLVFQEQLFPQTYFNV